MTISQKIVSALAVSIVASCGIVLFTAMHYMEIPLQASLDTNLLRLQHMVAATNDATTRRFADLAALAADNRSFDAAVASGEHARILPMAKKIMRESGSDFITITNEKGIVLARGHSAKYNDSVMNQETVVMALQGKPSACVVAGTEVPFTIRASQPIIFEDNIVGSLSIGTSLVSPEYLDYIKQMTGMEVTIFKGDTRVMTTIVNDAGQRVVGTKMTTPDIVNTVLRQGKPYFTQNSILGTEYASAYWPVHDLNGKVTGMWFLGAPISKVLAQRDHARLVSFTTAGGILAVMLILAALLGWRLAAPIKKITSYAVQLAQGNTDAQLDVHSKDDMGALADSLRAMVQKLKEQTQWYQSILDGIPFSISVTDMNMRWLFVNRAGLNLLRRTPEDIIGKPCKEAASSVCNTPQCGVETLRRGQDEVIARQADGTVQMIRVAHIKTAAGENVGHVELTIDITEQERLKAEAMQAQQRARQELATQMEGAMRQLHAAVQTLAGEVSAVDTHVKGTAASMDTVSVSMEQMNTAVRDVADNAVNAANGAEGARARAEEGAQVVEGVVTGIQSVRTTSLGLTTDMDALDDKSRNIGAILTIIRDIADQTNLLALNAAIEAARAGDAGRGFAVVADEVRKLAEKTMQATSDVEKAVASIQMGTRHSADTVQRVTTAIGELAEKAQKSGETLRGIVRLTTDASERVRAIASATEQQASSTASISASVETTSRGAADMAASMRAATNAMDEMTRQTAVLDKVVQDLRAE